MNDHRSIARTRRWPGRIARAFCYLVLGLLALSALGALIPAIPVFGSIGPLLIAPFGSWIVLLALAAAVPFALRWRRTRRRGALVIVGLAGFAALGTAIVIVDQVAVARANGIPIALGRTLWAGAPGHSGAAPIVARYGSERGQPLNLLVYRPAPRPDGAPAPIVVYVHGGGWSGGSITDRARDMRFLADHGYLVFSVGYTLSSETVHPWNLAEPQIGCALVRIAGQATRFGGDPTRLALLGESAGGNLVVNVAYKIAAGRLQPACAGPLPRIAAIIAPYPVLDAVRMYHNGDWIAGPFARLMTTRYTGSTPDGVPARYAAISSPRHIVAGAPPTLLLPGLADHLLPPVVAFDFERRAKAAGIPIRVIAVPHAEHSFDQAEGSVGSQIFRSASLQFLAQNGVVPHP